MDYNTILKEAHSKGLDRYEIASWLQEKSKEPKSDFYNGLEKAESFKDCSEAVKEAVLIAHTKWYQSTLTEKEKQERQESKYLEACKERLNNLISVFEKRYNGSEEKELLLNSEIALYTKLLKTKEPITDNNKFYLPDYVITKILKPKFNSVSFRLKALTQFEVTQIRKQFDKIIVNGFRDFKESELSVIAESFNSYLLYLNQKTGNSKELKTFADYLDHKKPEILASAIKENYSGHAKSGKTIAIMLHCLNDLKLIKKLSLTEDLPDRADIYGALGELFNYDLLKKRRGIDNYLDANYNIVELPKKEKTLEQIEKHKGIIEKFNTA